MKIPESGPSLAQILESKKDLSFGKETIGFSKKYNDRYLHWDDLKYQEFGKSTKEEVWALMKLLRSTTAEPLRIGKIQLSYNIPMEFQRTLHEIDTGITTGFASDKIDEDRKTMLAVSSMMEESIASSQLEGASTTTKLAKKLLRTKSSPKDNSQQMIVNNYNAMQFIKENSDKPLSPELIRSVHKVISCNTLEDAAFEGKFRLNNDIAVKDKFEDRTYYEPIDYKDIEKTIQELCNYINDDSVFVHPIVKGIILHFALAYVHPFVDGNGRVSRSMFYWYAIKNGYSLIEFLSISRVIKNHRQKYDLAYLKTETDENDLTYFIQYNLDMITESIKIFTEYLERKTNERKKTVRDLQGYDLNLRQLEIIKDMINTGDPVSVQELATKYQATNTTVRRDIIKMMDLGLITPSGKDGYRQLYRYSGKHR